MTHEKSRSTLIREQFPHWCKPRRGVSNPEIITNDVWVELIRNEYWPYKAHKNYGVGEKQSPGWCFSRYGQSETALDDGTQIYIGGEHEDSYDEDFYIYNDVIVKSSNGDIDIYAYPEDVFQPTDSHSATRVEDEIYIIGCIGYPECRSQTNTPVYVLSLHDFSIRRFETSGTAPGWLYKHEAKFNPDERAIYCAGGEAHSVELGESAENIATWRLCLTTAVWSCSARKPWSRWRLSRKDKKLNKLYEIDQVAYAETKGRPDKFSDAYKAELLNENYPLNFEDFQSRYRPPVEHEVSSSEDFRCHKIEIEGVIVRYDEAHWDVTVTVEGDLPKETLSILKSYSLDMLSKIEAAQYVLKDF